MTTVTFPSHWSPEKALIELWKGGFPCIGNLNPPMIEEAKQHLIRNDNYIDYFQGVPIKTCFINYPVLNSNEYDFCTYMGSMKKIANNHPKKSVMHFAKIHKSEPSSVKSVPMIF